MKRRDFLKYTGLLAGSSLFPAVTLYAADNYTGPLWLTIDALGGWDPTSLCDPKGSDLVNPDNSVNKYAAIDIRTPNVSGQETTPIRFAPTPPTPPEEEGGPFDPNLYDAQTFFDKYYSRLLIINGIDCKTLAHNDGRRVTWSGELARQGYPNFGALVAGLTATEKSMPFITTRGYSVSAGLLVPVRITGAGLNALREIAYPNRVSPNLGSDNIYFAQGEGETLDLINKASKTRLQRLAATQRLPRIKKSMDLLEFSRRGNSSLKILADYASGVGAPIAKTRADFNGDAFSFDLYNQGRIAMAAYKAGATAAAHISIGGFDTHNNHDKNQHTQLMRFLQGIDAIISEATAWGLEDKIVYVIGSDFGRTNKYNQFNGKDHWPITSMMLIGNSQHVIRGNRVIGATTDSQLAMHLASATDFSPVPDTTEGSIRITPAHIHRALRKLAGIEAITPRDFDLNGEDIDFFN